MDVRKIFFHKSILFYEAQRSGELPQNNRIPWRVDSFLLDGCSIGLDLTRGWFDAGDYVKFNFPQAFTVTLLAWGVIEFQDSYEKYTDEYKNVLDSLEWPLHYLSNCVISESEIIGQVGTGTVDHSQWTSTGYWLSRKRTCHKITVGSDLGGEMAAALAAGSIVYKNVDPEMSAKRLEKAKIAFTGFFKSSRR